MNLWSRKKHCCAPCLNHTRKPSALCDAPHFNFITCHKPRELREKVLRLSAHNQNKSPACRKGSHFRDVCNGVRRMRVGCQPERASSSCNLVEPCRTPNVYLLATVTTPHIVSQNNFRYHQQRSDLPLIVSCGVSVVLGLSLPSPDSCPETRRARWPLGKMV